ncbi:MULTISPECIES: serine/threonine-protein kinase [Streptomyces]|uniref:serine/threonine-protein kinase n=1 Tax=Streptomyces TaxID=1883 RepID=UPI001318C435|nr:MULTISPECIES: serine/threonine-protein kinase [Streptomyces]QGZ47540.1 protein kinase [Streptomyces sp. QHH-9511]GGT78821.1 hypothetical protein GCM10010272_23230 [Streptomyces lateritius]
MDAWTVPGYTEYRELGSGGSGRVVLAVHDATGVPVAVKYLAERMRADAAFVRGFRAEARLLGGLDTPHVVRFYEYVEAPRGAAIVMELVDGVALRALLSREGATGAEAALVVLKGSLLGLAAAHRAGVVHRDYKPENVLVGADGSSKLVDFGIATDHGSTPGVAGTPAYMAPEQWHGEPASPAADVYAATATFFECLTGRKPFAGENLAELALRHIEAPVPDEDAPEPLRPLIRRGLAKVPRERPVDAAVFVAELEAVATAGYGPDWEERGQRRLAALAALLPLLFPSADGPTTGTTTVATTTLPPPPPPRLRMPRGRPRAWPAAVAALILGVLAAVAARAGDEAPGRTTAQALATTSELPGMSPTASAPASPAPSSAAPSSEAPLSAPPTAASPPSGSPSSAPTTPPPSPPASPTAPTSSPPPPSTEPGSAPPSARPVAVKEVTVTGLRQKGPGEAEATFEVVTDGPGPVTLSVTWFTGDAQGEPGVSDGSESHGRSGATRYTFTLTHAFQGQGCYWGVRATTSPSAANGGSTQQILTRRCTVS